MKSIVNDIIVSGVIKKTKTRWTLVRFLLNMMDFIVQIVQINN